MPDQSPAENPAVNLRTITNVAYGLISFGFLTAGFFGIATVAALILLYVKRADAAGTIYAAHFDWLIQTFWWGLLWLALSGLATFIYIGWAGIIATVIWALYRLIRGWLALLESRTPLGT